MKYTINEILHLIFKDVEGKPFNDYTFTIDDVDDEGGSLTLVAPTNTPAGTKIIGFVGDEEIFIRYPDNTYHIAIIHIDYYQHYRGGYLRGKQYFNLVDISEYSIGVVKEWVEEFINSSWSLEEQEGLKFYDTDELIQKNIGHLISGTQYKYTLNPDVEIV
jgi:hypothetical protein